METFDVRGEDAAARTTTWGAAVATLIATLGLGGCATVDPRGAFEATRDLAASRHAGELVWQRDAEGRAVAVERVAELLAAPLDAASVSALAVVANPDLQAELERLGISQAELAEASRLANPGLVLSGRSGGGESKREGSLLADVVDWLVLPLRRRLAEAELERTRLEVARSVLEAVARAQLALVDYQAALAEAGLAARLEEVERAAADYADALHAAGNLTARERAEAEARWVESRAEARARELAAARRREALALAAGIDGAGGWEASRDPGLPPGSAADLASLAEAAVAARLDVAGARWAVAALERALTLRRRTRLLPLGLELGVERERETDGVTLTGPVVELRLPLFDTGKASVAKLESELAQARWQLAALEAAVRSGVRERARALDAALELHAWIRDRLLPLRREVVERTLREHNQMIVSVFDLLDAKRAELEAEGRLAAAEATARGAWIELSAASGGSLEPPVVASPAPSPADAPADPHAHHVHPAKEDGR